MPSRDAVIAAFAAFKTGGLHPPFAAPKDPPHKVKRAVAAAVGLWVAVLPELTDAELESAVVAFLRSGERFWPTPGQVLLLAPAAPARQLTARPSPAWFVWSPDGGDDHLRQGGLCSGQKAEAIACFRNLDAVWNDSPAKQVYARRVGIPKDPCRVVLFGKYEVEPEGDPLPAWLQARMSMVARGQDWRVAPKTGGVR